VNSYYAWLALELTRDRIRDADTRNRYRLDGDGLWISSPGVARRTLARAAATISRGSAALARRLDERVAPDANVRTSRLA
jgi:hypothetical protein